MTFVQMFSTLIAKRGRDYDSKHKFFDKGGQVTQICINPQIRRKGNAFYFDNQPVTRRLQPEREESNYLAAQTHGVFMIFRVYKCRNLSITTQRTKCLETTKFFATL